MLQADHISKRFGSFEAIRNISVVVRPGEIYGLIGPNGSGKTTTARTLVGLCRPDEGEVRVLGQTHESLGAELSRVIGYCPDEPPLYPKLTGSEMLQLVGSLHRITPSDADRRAKETLTDLGFQEEALGRFTGSYSRGMRRRLAIALSLLHRPRIIVMDEPTDSLDIIGVSQVRKLLANLRDGGAATLVATNDLDTATAVCDHVGLLIGGALVYSDASDNAQRDLGNVTDLETLLRQEVKRHGG